MHCAWQASSAFVGLQRFLKSSALRQTVKHWYVAYIVYRTLGYILYTSNDWHKTGSDMLAGPQAIHGIPLRKKRS